MEVGLLGKQAVSPALPQAFSARKFCLGESVRGGLRTSNFRLDLANCARRTAALRVAAPTGFAAVRSEMAVDDDRKPSHLPMKDKAAGGPVRLFVGLPLDVVSGCNALNHAKAIAAGLRVLKLLGVHGAELPVSWGVAANGDWSTYLAVARMARDAGLRLRVSLNLHASRRPHLPLPNSVARAVEADPDLLFTDRSRRRHDDCLSFAVDDLPVLDGKTPVEVFEEFFQSFCLAFSDLIGTTVTDITIGLGPNGELRFPSFPPASSANGLTGVGEFQCYDKYMLADLKRHAEVSGNALWGLSGPHDAPEYNESPESDNFFKECGGSWDTPYGQFFLSWYSGILLSHGDRILSIASKVFADLPVRLSAKLPLLHYWYNTRSRPSQLTAGFYNTDSRDGYDAVAEIFARNSCDMIIPGMDLIDRYQKQGVQSSPEYLLSQIMSACKKHGVKVSGENSLLTGAGTAGFNRIKENILAEKAMVDSFTYHRMGAEFFSPKHWPLFMEFVRSIVQMEIDSDDLPSNDERLSLSIYSAPRNDREMQAV